MRVRVGDRSVDYTDVRIEPLSLLLQRAELSIVAAALDGLAHRLVLALSAHVELLLSDESNQRVASLQNDRQRGVGVTQEHLRRVRRVSRQVLQHAESLLAHASVRLHDERQQSVAVRLCDRRVLAHLLLRANDGGNEWSVSDGGLRGERRGVGGASARHIDVELDAVAKQQQVAMAVPVIRLGLVGARHAVSQLRRCGCVRRNDSCSASRSWSQMIVWLYCDVPFRLSGQ